MNPRNFSFRRSPWLKCALILSLYGLAVMLPSCGWEDPSGSPTINEARLSSYQNHILPLAQPDKGNCIACHGSNGSQARWADNSDAAATKGAGYIDEGNPADSFLIVKATSGHYLPTGRNLGREAWLAAIEAYLADAKEEEDSKKTVEGNFFTTKQTIPENLPTFPANRVMSFDLTGIAPGIGNTSLSIRVAKDNTLNGTYRIWDPKLINASGSGVLVQGIRILLNDEYAPLRHGGDTYVSVHKIVPTGTNPTLSPQASLIVREDVSDAISLSFENLAPSSAPLCTEQGLALWNTIRPIFFNTTVTNTRCYTCHTVQGNAAVAAFDMRGSDEVTRCATFLARANLQDPAKSPLFVYPETNPVHPVRRTFTAAQKQDILRWIESNN